jgi:hypothetical protein
MDFGFDGGRNQLRSTDRVTSKSIQPRLQNSFSESTCFSVLQRVWLDVEVGIASLGQFEKCNSEFYDAEL